ncbi:MAG: hypothetical protein FWD47_08285 [Treponema sp.]|nr:hypothetical protein [Treponema sp.]
MNFSFSIRDFLNDFSIGFIFVGGIFITNVDKFIWLINTEENYLLFIFILMYIIGIVISSIGYFIDFSLYVNIDSIIRKIRIKPINKVFYWIKMSTLYFFFRRWTVVETFLRLVKNKKLPEEISHLITYNDFSILVDKILGKSQNFIQIYFYKSQFFQGCANSILFVFLSNLIILKHGQISLMECIIYIAIFFIFKMLSPVLGRIYILDIARKATSLGLIEKDKSNA